MQVRLSPSKARLRQLMEACYRLDLALSAGVRVALEWYEAQAGRPLPRAAGRHRAFSAKTGDDPKQVLLYLPKPWVDQLGGGAEGVRKRTMAAVAAWLAAGSPAVDLMRTSEHLRRREQAAKDNADAGSMSPVKLQLGKARALVIAAAEALGLAASTLIRRTVAEAYQARTGATLPAAPESDARKARTREGGTNDLSVSFPIAWLVAIDTAIPGSRQSFMEAAVYASVGMEKPRPAYSPGVASMVETRRERARYELRGSSSAPRARMAAEAREQSRWPVGRGVCMGAMTGRPYVGTVARDERAEGVAA